ncbi:arylacetamide deacetylase-like 3 isoform X2 [Ailuropoda melanoleuca]|uniref:arylacetamide deacetylase-like 3 isoform X2 n=1 Tax=Ailuropoda melanoleuca TaxID=9646 RepID=UPI000947ABEC|nr:arylacetamide deacetylase-like 3 isoform X2 [Ailuropoda melanoleuca]
MVALLLLLQAACVFSVGVGLWVIGSHFFTADIPAAVGHPVKLRVLHCVFQLLLTWGMIFEKLGICSMPRFVRFMHDLVPLKEDPDVVVTDLCYGTIPVKLYQPKVFSCTPRLGIVFYHGGGMLIGSLRTHNAICCHLSKKSDSVVLAVGYRKLPQHKFPVALRDCVVATTHFLKSLNKYGVDPDRVVVCGDSVGGGMATVICQRYLGCPDLPKIRAQILIYASLQAVDFQLPSYQQNKNVPLASRDFAFYCWSTVLDIKPSWKSTIMKGAHLPAEFWKKYRKWLGAENIPERFKKRPYQPKTSEPLNESAYLETSLALDSMNSPLIAEDEVVSQLPETFIVSWHPINNHLGVKPTRSE